MRRIAKEACVITEGCLMKRCQAMLAVAALIFILLASAASAQQAPDNAAPAGSGEKEKHLHNYPDFDKSCTRWTDQCRTCSREAGAELNCSNIGIACTPAEVECVQRPKEGAQSTAPDYAAMIAAPDRTDADRQTDQRRDPLPLLSFLGLRPGMKVLDMGAGGGYSTELVARAVAPNGVVYAQNPADTGERAKARFEARQQTPSGRDIIALVRPFDDPAPPEIRDLDLVTFLFFYHDTTYMPVNRAQMNRRLYSMLKPGGLLVIADHSARAGDGTSVGKTLHRIEEGALRGEVEAAGFRWLASGDFWRHPEDTRDFSVQPPTRPIDEFVLKFEKPQ
jgi:predicted methyltransferase